MADLLWQEVEAFFDPELNGRFPDVHVPETTLTDWQTLLDLVRSQDWGSEYAQGADVLPVSLSAAVFVAGYEVCALLRVWPVPGVEAIFRSYGAGRIDFDMDLCELQGQERLDMVCEFFRAIGRALGKPVLMTWEGALNGPYPFLGFRVEADRVVLLADPDRPGAAPAAW